MPLPYTNNEHLLRQNIRCKYNKKACRDKIEEKLEKNEFKSVVNLTTTECMKIEHNKKLEKKKLKSLFVGANCTYIRNCEGTLKLIEGIVTSDRMRKNKWLLIKYAKI